jgi:hypothetical protein
VAFPAASLAWQRRINSPVAIKLRIALIIQSEMSDASESGVFAKTSQWFLRRAIISPLAFEVGPI